MKGESKREQQGDSRIRCLLLWTAPLVWRQMRLPLATRDASVKFWQHFGPAFAHPVSTLHSLAGNIQSGVISSAGQKVQAVAWKKER